MWLFRTCVERGGAVRSALVIGDLDHVEYDYIITVLLNASVRDLQRYVDVSNHSLLDELLDDLGETSRKFFVFCNVPQQRKILGCSRLRWVVGAERCAFLSYTPTRGCDALGSN